MVFASAAASDPRTRAWIYVSHPVLLFQTSLTFGEVLNLCNFLMTEDQSAEFVVLRLEPIRLLSPQPHFVKSLTYVNGFVSLWAVYCM